ncbi:hypothetical protein GALMADRAFT_1219007 [Galerina marginata CBS 339.88]|uniref:Uncharacterized protein n=1 Tax=Galerina marginata (strain CBS 339.88) TaxID=685588 RepID=A0A067SG85_GALM3|nr:hypothetical protein GALMADRAFT_1219007 [Galerina marginata CBS 339.88]
MLQSGLILRHVACIKAILGEIVESKIGNEVTSRREIQEITEELQRVEDQCFHQMLSPTDVSALTQMPNFSSLPISFPQLCQIPWNDSQLTKNFLIKYSDLVEVTVTFHNHGCQLLVYRLCPGLIAFISSPNRAGALHHCVRKHFIRIIDEALGYSYSYDSWKESDTVGFNGWLSFFVASFLSFGAFSDVESNQNEEDVPHLRSLVANLCRLDLNWHDKSRETGSWVMDLILWTHRQLNSTVGAALLVKLNQTAPQKLVAQMERLIQSHVDDIFLRPYFTEMWVVNQNRLLCLHFKSWRDLTYDEDDDGYVEEDISMTHGTMLADGLAQAYLAEFHHTCTDLTEILDKATYTLSIDRAQVFTLLLQFHLFYFIKKLYCHLNPDANPGLMNRKLPVYIPIDKWFEQANPTEKIHEGLLGLCTMHVGSGTKWTSSVEFCTGAMDFLKRCDFDPEDRSFIEDWLKDTLKRAERTKAGVDSDSDSDSDSDMEV